MVTQLAQSVSRMRVNLKFSVNCGDLLHHRPIHISLNWILLMWHTTGTDQGGITLQQVLSFQCV